MLLRYGRTLDWLDGTGQESCFWPDAEVDYGFFQGSGKDWVPLVMDVEAGSAHRWHVSTGIMIQLQGDNAKSECYGITVARSENDEGEGVDTIFGGRYLDELQKRDGVWRISKRRYIADWSNGFPDGLKGMAENGLVLNTLQISEPNHEAYRQL